MKLIFFAAFYLFHLGAFGQYTWVRKNDFLGGARFHAVSVTVENKALLGLGNTSTIGYQDWWLYDQAGDVWTQLSDFPAGPRVSAISFSIDSIAYVGTGFNSVTTQYTDDLWAYSLVTNSWSQKASMGTIGRVRAASFSIGRFGYVLTGEDNNMTNFFKNDVWKYNSDSDSWQQLSDFPGVPRSFATGLSLNGKGYLACGGQETFPYDNNELWCFDTTNNSWTQKTPLPGLARQAAVGWTSNNSLFFGFGFNSLFNLELNDFLSYNSDSNSWVQLDTIPLPGIQRGSAFTLGNLMYFATGVSSTQFYDQLWLAMPDSLNTIPELEEEHIKIFPQPADQFLFISNDIRDNAIVTIYSMTGETVLSTEINFGKQTIDIRHLHPGTYLIQMHLKNKRFAGKIVII